MAAWIQKIQVLGDFSATWWANSMASWDLLREVSKLKEGEGVEACSPNTAKPDKRHALGRLGALFVHLFNDIAAVNEAGVAADGDVGERFRRR